MHPALRYFALSLAISVAHAASLPGLLTTKIVILDALLNARQGVSIPQVPPQCQTTCNPVNAVLGTKAGCTPAQCCNATFENGYFNCFKCVADGIGVTDFSAPQNLLDMLYDQCAVRGIQLPILTFPGQNANRPLSAVASGTGTTTSSSSAPTSPGTQSTVTTAPTPTSQSSLTQSTVTSNPTPTAPNPAPTNPPSSGLRTAYAEGSLIISGAIMGVMLFTGYLF